ncbi:hypothetical protein QBC34DRAFT_402920 [Podospora aff. communis PSN243]|uniref:Uncharacterized protein n=1 Tax=Podospora aff. communis PSN243 TaxID=3040156 RepID=A0AAV9GTA3_9PEZI|nr:hypothetical protein QBC34DRAFT_402920 [Podospora aff. communis PSN243]
MDNTKICDERPTPTDLSSQARLPRESYVTHLRQSSRTSFDNSYSSLSPTLRPRPRSAIYNHENHRSHRLQSTPPRVTFDRWSYDRERMMGCGDENTPSTRHRSAMSNLSPPTQLHRRAVSTGDLPTLSLPLPGPHTQQPIATHMQYSQTSSPSPSLRNYRGNRSSMLSTCTVEFDLVDPSSPGKGATRLSLVEVDHEHGHNNSTNAPRDREKLKGEEEGLPGPGCCGCCELGTAKLVGGKLVAWMTGTMLPIVFGSTIKLLANCFK